MAIRDMTFTDAERLEARAADNVETALEMDEAAFRAFYDRTARPLWTYLWRITGDRYAADDLLQDTYYRLLRTRATHDGDAHRRHALFHIATNLARDAKRRRRVRERVETFGRGRGDAGDAGRIDRHDARSGVVDVADVPDPRSGAAEADRRVDLTRAMAHLSPRERALVWLAYAHGSSHREIAGTVGVGTASVKLLLFRARRKLAAWLRAESGEAADGARGRRSS
jgi:RNA polymerase sigma-70 factor (ECF subfamily)